MPNQEQLKKEVKKWAKTALWCPDTRYCMDKISSWWLSKRQQEIEEMIKEVEKMEWCDDWADGRIEAEKIITYLKEKI